VLETDIDESSVEDRRACELVTETPGDGRMLNVNGPLQLGGKSNQRTKYPGGVLRDGFNGCIKNFFHNGQVTDYDHGVITYKYQTNKLTNKQTNKNKNILQYYHPDVNE